MTPILELINRLGLGIVSLIICFNVMAADNFPIYFYNIAKEVQKEYDKGSFEKMIDPALVATIASIESGYGDFENADTAKAALNYMGRHAIGDEEFLTTTGGAKLKKYKTVEDNVRDFLNLMSTGRYYSEFRNAVERGASIEDQFKTLTKYSTNPDYSSLLSGIYKKRILPSIQTENMLIPKSKPKLKDQMEMFDLMIP